MEEHERRFELFGSRVRLLIGPPAAEGLLRPELAALEVEATMRMMHRALSRFEPDSELSRLNRDPRRTVEVSLLVATLVEAAIRASRESGGLVDATVLDALERAGYDRSLKDARLARLSEALIAAPRRAPASANPAGRWREIEVDLEARTVTRPPGVRIDSGGIGKGLAADLGAARLSGYGSFVVDCGGDVRIGGSAAVPRSVEVDHPLRRSLALEFPLRAGAVATSGLRSRLWRRGDGFAHHLIDPGTGLPAWTGLVQATAVAPLARTAETLAKAAVLSGPEEARGVLAEHGGVLIHDDGEVEALGLPALTDEPEPAAEVA